MQDKIRPPIRNLAAEPNIKGRKEIIAALFCPKFDLILALIYDPSKYVYSLTN
jgi:hypothetical protein